MRSFLLRVKNPSLFFGHFQNDALFVVFCSHALNYIQTAQVIWHVLSYENKPLLNKSTFNVVICIYGANPFNVII